MESPPTNGSPVTTADAPVRDERRIVAPAVLVGLLAALLLAAGVTPYWRVSPDSALYAGIARSLAAGGGYTFAGETAAGISPVVPFYLAPACKLAHLVDPGVSFVDTFVYFNAFIAAAAFAGLVAAYFLAREIAGSKRALLVLVLLVFSRVYFNGSVNVLTDVPYAAASWAALYFVLKAERRGGAGTAAAAAVLVAVSTLTRLTGITLALSIVLYHIVKAGTGREGRRESLVGLCIAAPALLAAGFFVYLVISSSGRPAYNYYDHFFRGLGFGEGVRRYWTNVSALLYEVPRSVLKRENNPLFIGAVLGVLGLGLAKSWRKGARLPCIYFALYFLYLPLGEETVVRYLVPLLPFLYLYGIDGLGAIANLLERGVKLKLSPPARRITGFVIVAVVVALNAPSIAGEIALGHSKDFYDRYADGDARDYFAISSALSADPGGGRVLAKNVRVVGALSGVRAVQLFFHPRSRSEYTVAAVDEFVRQYDVTAIVVDPAHEKTAVILAAFVKQNPDDWSHKGSFGRLDLYVLTGRSSGERDGVAAK